jgi:Abortive infection C-terminus
MATLSSAQLPPIDLAIVIATAELFNDWEKSRTPSHSDVTEQIERSGLLHADIKAGKKKKRIRQVLTWALENDEMVGRRAIRNMLDLARGSGGFLANSPNYVGVENVRALQAALRVEGCILTDDGTIMPVLLDGFGGVEANAVLRIYVRRAARGYDDAALVLGTSKDLLEATSAHVLTEIYTTYSESANFPLLLGQAFAALEMAATEAVATSRVRKLEVALFEAGCKVNALRNKDGVGHGRPWLPDVTDAEARAALRTMATISDLMLERLASRWAPKAT